MKILLEQMEGRKSWNVLLQPFALNKHFLELKDQLDYSDYHAIGSFRFVQTAQQSHARSFLDYDITRWSYYAPYYGDHLLNSDYILIPVKELSRLRYSSLMPFYSGCSFFIRPNNSNKAFDGQKLDMTEIDYFLNYYKECGEELAVISSLKNILGEWRFVCEMGGEVLGYSLYRYQNELISHPSCPPKMLEYVKKELISLFPWKSNIPLIVMDIAQMPTMEFKLIEVNSFSCSGLYDCAPEKIVEYIKNQI